MHTPLDGPGLDMPFVQGAALQWTREQTVVHTISFSASRLKVRNAEAHRRVTTPRLLSHE